jgi:hypothetical protein
MLNLRLSTDYIALKRDIDRRYHTFKKEENGYEKPPHKARV